MGYLNESGLARYDGLLKNWVTFKSGTVDGIDALLNWQKTATASTVSFYPLPAAPLDPVVNFAFTETGPAEGEKSPTNPSTITGVSSITVTRCETVGVDSTDYTIDLNGTYYGGSVDLSAGTMTVTHVIRTVDGTNVKLVDNGETTNYYRLYFPIVYSQTAADRVLDTKCTFIDTAYFGYNTDSEHYYVGTDRVYVFLDKTLPFLSGSGTVVEKANAYATQMVQDGTPWSVTYKLATPYTVSLTPTQAYSLSQIDPYTPRLNTVYSDQQSVQVGYPKSPLATSTELTNAIISLGSNL